MAFGQTSGPPASNKELTRLAELLEAAGFDSFKAARHPFELTQRQAAGKFSREEATALIERLERDAEFASLSDHDGGETDAPTEPAPATKVARAPRTARVARVPRPADRLSLAATPDDVLVEELELRGWTCIPPVTL